MRFITIKKFTQLTGIPDDTVRAGIKDRRLSWVWFGKRKLVDFRAFENDMDAQIDQMQDISPGKQGRRKKRKHVDFIAFLDRETKEINKSLKQRHLPKV